MSSGFLWATTDLLVRKSWLLATRYCGKKTASAKHVVAFFRMVCVGTPDSSLEKACVAHALGCVSTFKRARVSRPQEEEEMSKKIKLSATPVAPAGTPEEEEEGEELLDEVEGDDDDDENDEDASEGSSSSEGEEEEGSNDEDEDEEEAQDTEDEEQTENEENGD